MDVFTASLKDYSSVEGSTVKVFPMPRSGRGGGGISLMHSVEISISPYKLVKLSLYV